MFLEPRFGAGAGAGAAAGAGARAGVGAGAGAGAGAGVGSSCWCAVIKNADNISGIIENDIFLYFTLHCGKQ